MEEDAELAEKINELLAAVAALKAYIAPVNVAPINAPGGALLGVAP